MGYLPSPFKEQMGSTPVQAQAYGPLNKVSVVLEDITKLHVDALVNPTNPNFYSGGARTASGAITNAAGVGLIGELQLRQPLEYGAATTTPSFELPCHYIIHTAVPSASSPNADETLRNCYTNSLLELVGQKKQTIAFPCIGTGVQRFDHKSAAHIAMRAVRDFFIGNQVSQLQQVIFCVYSREDLLVYQTLLPTYFV